MTTSAQHFTARPVKVLEHQNLAGNVWLMKLHDPVICNSAKPAQFVMVDVPGVFLKRPLAIAWIEKEKSIFWMIYRVVGSGTQILTEVAAGSNLEITGPLGNWFDFGDKIKQNIIIVGGIGIAPGAWLAQCMAEQDLDVKLLFGLTTEKEKVIIDAFPISSKTGISLAVEEDGDGTVVDLLINKKFNPNDAYFACGPTGMYKALQKLNLRSIRATFEERMACGLGICAGCVVEMKKGDGFHKYKRVCINGPVFELNEVILP